MNDNDRLNKTIADIAYTLDSLRVLKEIYQAGNCNNCTNRDCGYLPKPGQLIRYNCPFYKQKDDTIGTWINGICDNCGYNWNKNGSIAKIPEYCPNCGQKKKSWI